MKQRLVIATLIAALAALLLAIVSLAQGTYDAEWHTVDGGGATFSTGGGYTLGGTAGQPDAGILTGGGYTLAGGFWGGAEERHHVYLPLVLRSY